MKMKNVLLILAMAFICLACDIEVEGEAENQDSKGPRKPSLTDTIKDQPLDGEIGGLAWTVISGRVKKSTFGENQYTYDFWNEDREDVCSAFEMGSDAKLLGMFPLSLGEHQFGNTNNLNFAISGENKITTNGVMIITDVTSDKVSGKLLAKYDDKNYVNGEFTLTLCP